MNDSMDGETSRRCAFCGGQLGAEPTGCSDCSGTFCGLMCELYHRMPGATPGCRKPQADATGEP